MTEEQLIDVVARTIERAMFAPHEFPLPHDLEAKYRVTARSVVDALKFARQKLVKTAAEVPDAGSAQELAGAVRELFPHGWQPIDDHIIARAIDRFSADATRTIEAAAGG